MDVAQLAVPSPPRPLAGWRSLVAISLAALIAFAFFVSVDLPYLTLDATVLARYPPRPLPSGTRDSRQMVVGSPTSPTNQVARKSRFGRRQVLRGEPSSLATAGRSQCGDVTERSCSLSTHADSFEASQ